MHNNTPIYLASCASWLPVILTSTQEGISSQEYDPIDATQMAYESIAIAPAHITVMDMATAAANNALKQAQVCGQQLEMLSYNAVHRHGHPQLWCPASYLQHKLTAETAIPLSIYQGCNGQLLAIDMMSKVLKTSQKEYALAVAADKFSAGGINRWHGDYGIVYGDAATAVVLSRINGFAKILNLQTVSHPALEALHRFDATFNHLDSDYHQKYYNVRLAKKHFLQKFGKDAVINATQSAMKLLWEKTFSRQAIAPADIRHFIFPNLAKNILEKNYFSIHPLAAERSLWDFGKQVGHLGASDCIAGLSYLSDNKQLVSGDKILCIGAGSGFSWSFMLIEIT